MQKSYNSLLCPFWISDQEKKYFLSKDHQSSLTNDSMVSEKKMKMQKRTKLLRQKR
jgi:hypothetical protein